MTTFTKKKRPRVAVATKKRLFFYEYAEERGGGGVCVCVCLPIDRGESRGIWWKPEVLPRHHPPPPLSPFFTDSSSPCVRDRFLATRYVAGQAEYAQILEITIPEAPLTMLWYGEMMCLGGKRDYRLLNIKTGICALSLRALVLSSAFL